MIEPDERLRRPTLKSRLTLPRRLTKERSPGQHPAGGAGSRLGGWVLVAAVLPVLALSACGGSESETSGAGCAVLPAKEALTNRAGPRGGVVRAHVQLTGKQATTDDHGAVSLYSELKIVEPEVVAGHDPHVSTGWVLGGKTSDGTPQLARQPEGSLWGTDGAAVLVINPAETLRDHPDKVELLITPLVGDSVITSQAGCWGLSDLRPSPSAGS